MDMERVNNLSDLIPLVHDRARHNCLPDFISYLRIMELETNLISSLVENTVKSQLAANIELNEIINRVKDGKYKSLTDLSTDTSSIGFLFFKIIDDCQNIGMEFFQLLLEKFPFPILKSRYESNLIYSGVHYYEATLKYLADLNDYYSIRDGVRIERDLMILINYVREMYSNALIKVEKSLIKEISTSVKQPIANSLLDLECFIYHTEEGKVTKVIFDLITSTSKVVHLNRTLPVNVYSEGHTPAIWLFGTAYGLVDKKEP
jgi:hypothetical protein